MSGQHPQAAPKRDLLKKRTETIINYVRERMESMQGVDVTDNQRIIFTIAKAFL